MKKKILELVFLGEFGYEIAGFVPWIRKISREYQKTKIYSFQDMEPLYKDFADFAWNGSTNRLLKFPYKKYKVDGEYYKYGTPNLEFDILIHGRGIKRKNSYNYREWEKVAKAFPNHKIACVGTMKDQYIEGTIDKRGIDLQLLMDYCAGSKCIVGVSSGTIHLASFCGCSQVVIGYEDNKTYYFESQRKRYKETWNPFNSKIEYIAHKNWKPEPEEIIERINKLV